MASNALVKLVSVCGRDGSHFLRTTVDLLRRIYRNSSFAEIVPGPIARQCYDNAVQFSIRTRIRRCSSCSRISESSIGKIFCARRARSWKVKFTASSCSILKPSLTHNPWNCRSISMGSIVWKKSLRIVSRPDLGIPHVLDSLTDLLILLGQLSSLGFRK